MYKNFIVMCSLYLCLFSSQEVNLGLNYSNNAQNTRQIVCCENMHRVSTRFTVHSAQVNNYPMCTATVHKTSYCSNCYAIFEQSIISSYEHEDPDVF